MSARSSCAKTCARETRGLPALAIRETAMRAGSVPQALAGAGLRPAKASNRKLTTALIDYEISWIVACETWSMVVSTLALAS
jgi:hypothetical protein